jgi:hypothetical protein
MDTPIAPTIDNASAQIQNEIDKAADEIAAQKREIATEEKALPDSYADLSAALAVKGANVNDLVKKHAESVLKHDAKLKRLQIELNEKDAIKRALEAQKAKLLAQLSDPDV